MSGKTMCSERIVQWGDSDPAGRINSPRAFDFAVEIVEAFFRTELGVNYRQLIQELGLGAPVVHSSCDYTSMLLEGDTVRLTLSVERLGTASVTWRVVAHHWMIGAQAFSVRMISCFINNASGKSVPIPETWRQKIGTFVSMPEAMTP